MLESSIVVLIGVPERIPHPCSQDQTEPALRLEAFLRGVNTDVCKSDRNNVFLRMDIQLKCSLICALGLSLFAVLSTAAADTSDLPKARKDTLN
jgi:hypothetical protein